MKTFAAITVALTIGLPVVAETPEEKGLAIAIEADRRDEGFGDNIANLTMILRNRHGQQTSRVLRTRTLEQADDGDKSLIIFDNPGDVKGTAFLSFTHKEGPDDQWLYLPALKRVKRIASGNKSGPFMGSEFAYEDISSQEVEKYGYKVEGERNSFSTGQAGLVTKRGELHGTPGSLLWHRLLPPSNPDRTAAAKGRSGRWKGKKI